MFRRWTSPSALAIALICLATACAPYATYPPIDGAVGLDNPVYEPVPTLMADALRYAHDRYGTGHADFAINLPPGTPAKVYDMVIKKLAAGHPMTDSSEWGYHLIELRSRGFSAEADMVIPRSGAPHALITLHLEKEFNNYTISTAKVWNLPTTVPRPHYTPPPPVEEALAQQTNE